jgi:transporter family protein
MSWLVFSIITLLLWGIWGFFAKLATSFFSWKEYIIVSGCASALIILLVYLIWRPSINIKNQGGFYSILSGIFGTLPVIFFYKALENGKASIVIPLTALYPLVTILLSFLILKEKLTFIQELGILFALLSIILIAVGR